MADPMHQFEIHKVVDLPSFTLPGVGAIDMSITNSTVAMLAAAALVVLFFAVTTAKAAVVPGRLQVIGEGMFSYIDDLVAGIIGHEGRKFFPYILTLFMFILMMNMLGMFLVFTATSQLAVTASLAVMTMSDSCGRFAAWSSTRSTTRSTTIPETGERMVVKLRLT